jgi:DNA-directed RNA polymerase specialized sigma24 family protein
VSARSDRELVDDIRAGRRSALGILFDRYSPQLYEFVYLVIGDRDETARLLEQIFDRVPTALEGVGEHDSVRGWLYALAREAALGFISQRGWLERLPPSDTPAAPGLRGDIWRAARAMPAFLRAVLVAEELHVLSPTEKARALNVARADWGRVVEDAQRSFTLHYDLLARQQGHLLATQVEPERAEGIQPRMGMPGSLFAYMPVAVLPDSLASAVRGRILSDVPVPALATVPAPAVQETVREPQVLTEPQDLPPPRPALLPAGCTLPAVLTALVVAMVITAIAACVGIWFIRDGSGPTITRLDPTDQAVLAAASDAAVTHVVISASFQDNRAIDLSSVRLVVDNADVTPRALITGGGISYPVDLASGPHSVVLTLRDSSGNATTRAWQFTVGPAAAPTPTPTPTATLAPTPTAAPTPTPAPTNTLVPLPVIASFGASETNVPADRPVTLSWSVSGADIVFLNQDRVDPTSSRAVSLKTTTTFHLIANNAAGTVEKAITITVQSLPDVIVSDIAINPAGQISYTIKNAGPGDVTQMFLIQVLVDNIPVDSNRRVSSLPAGQEVSLSVPNYTLLGTHLVTVRLNATQEIQETNFNNDELTRTIVGPTPTPTNTVTRVPTNTPTSTPTLTQTPTAMPSNTPTSTPAPVVVTTVTATLGSTSPYTGTCPATFVFTGTITTNGATTVIFRWDRSDGVNSGPFSVVFAGAGTQTFTNQWIAPPTGAAWTRLHILAPNDTATPNVNIQNNCH